MSDYDFQCSCGAKFDGDVFHDPPENCPECAAPKSEFEPIEPERVDDRKENEHDFDYLAGKG